MVAPALDCSDLVFDLQEVRPAQRNDKARAARPYGHSRLRAGADGRHLLLFPSSCIPSARPSSARRYARAAASARYIAKRPRRTSCTPAAMPSSRLLILLLSALLAAFPAPARAGPTGSLAWLPDEVLDDTHLSTYSSVVAELRAAIPAGVVYHRHQGRHRLSDRPMGGVLVAPVEERRVPIVDGMRAHFDAAVILPFPPDHRLRSSILPPDIQLAIRRAYLHGPRLPFFRRERASLVRRLSDQLRPVSARIASLMQPSVLRCAGSINVAFIAAFIDASNWLDVDLPRRLVEGFTTVGECCDSGVYRRIEPLVSREKWQARLARFVSSTAPWNRVLLRRLARRASAAGADRLADVALAAKTARS